MLALPVVLAIGFLASGRFEAAGITSRFDSIQSLEAFTEDANVLGRLAQWPVLWGMWLHRPFGTGFFLSVPGFESSIHNLYFMVALSTGVIGLVCYLGFSLACLLHWLQGLAFDDPVVISVSIGAIAGVVVILVNGLSSGILWRVHLNLWYTLVVAAAVGTVEAERRSFQRPIYEAAPPESKQSDA